MSRTSRSRASSTPRASWSSRRGRTAATSRSGGAPGSSRRRTAPSTRAPAASGSAPCARRRATTSGAAARSSSSTRRRGSCVDEGFSDDQGNRVSAQEFGMTDDMPSEDRVTVTLEERDGRTRMTMRQGIPPRRGGAQRRAAGVARDASTSWTRTSPSCSAAARPSTERRRRERGRGRCERPARRTCRSWPASCARSTPSPASRWTRSRRRPGSRRCWRTPAWAASG